MYVLYYSIIYLGPDGPCASVVGEAEHGVGAPVGLHPVSIGKWIVQYSIVYVYI